MKYCTYCGKRLNDDVVCSCVGPQKSSVKKVGGTGTKSVKPLKKLAALVGLALLVVIALICVISYVNTTVDLEDYIVVKEVSGLNGQGVLSYSLDKSALTKRLVGEEDYDNLNENNFGKVLSKAWEEHELAEKAIDSIQLEASQETGLSNGDTVTITATFKRSGGDKFPYHFKNASIQHTVSGLAEGKRLDPFAEEYVSVVFSGINTYGQAEVTILSDESPISLFRYTISKKESLSNGEAVTLSVEVNSEKLTKAGYFVPEQMERMYTVSGLAEGKSVDPFAAENVSIRFTGVSPRGEAAVEILSSEAVVSLFRFKLSESKNLRNGDTVMLTASVNEEKLMELGYLAPSVLEKSYVVEGLGEYLDIQTGFPEDLQIQLVEEAERLSEEAAEDFSFKRVSSINVQGTYFLKALDPASPYEDLWKGRVFDNLVAVITSYTVDFGGGIGHEEQWKIWIFPNFSVDAAGSISYQVEETDSYTERKTNLEKMEAYLQGKYSMMSMTKLEAAE